MSQYSCYEWELKQLEATRCESCLGSGVCDDAEPGDISFKTWKCTTCKGTGKKPGSRINPLAPVPELRNSFPLILYFGNTADRDDFIALIKEAKPGLVTRLI